DVFISWSRFWACVCWVDWACSSTSRAPAPLKKGSRPRAAFLLLAALNRVADDAPFLVAPPFEEIDEPFQFEALRLQVLQAVSAAVNFIHFAQKFFLEGFAAGTFGGHNPIEEREPSEMEHVELLFELHVARIVPL